MITTVPTFNVTPTRLVNTLESGRVTRYHAAPMVSPQSLGSHQWGVLMIVLYITGGDASRDLILEAVMHDAAELYTGDVPFNAKRANPDLKSHLERLETAARYDHLLLEPQILTLADTAILKLADTLEGFIWCCEEERGTLIKDRWSQSFRTAIDKFKDHIPIVYLTRALDVYNQFGGSLTPEEGT